MLISNLILSTKSYVYIVVYKLYKVNKFQNGRNNLLLEVVCGNRVC